MLAGLLLLFACVFGHPSSTETVLAQGDPTQEILHLVNGLRSQHGLAPFIWDQRLAAAAQNQANYMATNNIYSHTGEGGSSPQTRAQAAGFPGRATENIVGGTNLTPGQGVIWWQNSPIHLNTLLAPHYSHVGIARANGFEQNFYALVAGAPSNIVASAPPQATEANDQLLAPVAPIELAVPGENGSIVHVVGPGHSFWAIAARYEIPLDQLYLFNNLNEDSVINPGDELVIRLADGQEPPPTATPPANHIVREGDSWWTIAAWHKLSVDDVLWLNSASEESVLRPGDEVRIRLLLGESPPPTATPKILHIVSAGETAWDIAVRYGLTLGEFLEINKLDSNAIISIGEELIIVTATIPSTETLVPTHTPAPTATETRINTPTPIPTPQAVSEAKPVATAPVLAYENIDPENANQFGRVGLIAGFVLLFIGLIATIFVWRRPT